MKRLNLKLWKRILFRGLKFAILGAVPEMTFADTTYPNPIQATDFADLVQNLAIAIRDIAIPFAVIGILFAGFKFILGAMGDKNAISEGKKILWYVLLGAAIVVAASVIATAVVNFAKSL